MDKKLSNKILFRIIVIFLVVIGIGIAYAYISYSAHQTGTNLVVTDCIEVELEELTDAITLENAYPITDDLGSNTKPYNFKITNICTTGINYNVNLEVLGIKNGEKIERFIKSEYISSRVDNEDIKKLTNYIEATPTYKKEDYEATESYTLYTGSLKKGESITHSIRIWLNEDAGNDSQNATFYSKIVIEATENQIIVMKDYLKDLSQYDKSIVKMTHENTTQTGSNANVDYRYVGKNPNNYVCFGSEESPCSEENLYRIIGVIPTQSSSDGLYEDRVKLIKNSYYLENESGLVKNNTSAEWSTPSGLGYDWNTNRNNNWEVSNLQSEVLNGVYWNSLGEYQNYIEPAKWYLGASSYSAMPNSNTPNAYYLSERSNTQNYSKGTLNYINNIGLMYPSDYGYSLGAEYSTSSIYANRDRYIQDSWLDLSSEGKYAEWTISPTTIGWDVDGPYVEIVRSGYINSGPSSRDNNSHVYSARPTFYLKSSILYKSGNGTKENPYRLNLS